MNLSKYAVVCCLLVGSVVMAVSTLRLAAAGQAVSSPTEPLAALLVEVRALRIAMERSASVTPRVQLTLARLNIEEQRIAQLVAQLEQARRELSAASLESQKLSDVMSDMENQLPAAPDEHTRRAYEQEQRGLKRRLSLHTALEQQLRTRETDAAQALSTEQARWIELNSRLDDLERLLAPVPR